jgi:hypothetical protein
MICAYRNDLCVVHLHFVYSPPCSKKLHLVYDFEKHKCLLQVIDYHNEDFAEVFSGTPIDLVYDCVGGYEQWRKGREILSPEGSFVTIVGDSAGTLNMLELVSKGHNCSSLPLSFLLLCSLSFFLTFLFGRCEMMYSFILLL